MRVGWSENYGLWYGARPLDMPSIRQKLTEALEASFGAISKANGFYTDVVTVDTWRVVPFRAEELPALVIRDLSDDKEKADAYASRQSNELLFSIEIVVAEGKDSMATLRDLFSDIARALRLMIENEASDWNKLTRNTKPKVARPILEQETRKVAGGVYEFTVDYVTDTFNEDQ